MTGEHVERRLAAVLAADMVGYSRLMELDEVGVLARQRAHRAQLIDPKIAEHRGRIVKLMGDGMLVEFASVVDAVACAADIQREMPKREADVPEDRRIRYRIGVNLGDIVVEGDDIFGDGVNIAARLEAMAEPGGVCVSGAAFDQLKQRVAVGYESLGEHAVKNIATPVRAYRVLLAAEDAGRIVDRAPRRRLSLGVAIAAAFLVALIGLGAVFWLQQPDFEPADAEKFAFPLPDRPSIAVLPFASFAAEPAQDHIADGFTETLIDVLAQVPDLFVIARNSAFAYKGKAVDVREVAEALGVRYVLEGSIQRADDTLRVTAQLIDAVEGQHLWSKRFDGPVDDLFKFQDKITFEIGETLRLKLVEGDMPRLEGSVTTFEAWSRYVKAISLWRRFDKESLAHSRKLLEEAIEIEPDAGALWQLLGWTHLSDTRMGFAKSLEKAKASAKKSVALAPNSPFPHNLLGSIYVYEKDFERGLAAQRKAVELSPYHPSILGSVARTLFLTGNFEEAVELETRAIRLSPFYPTWHLMNLSRALTFLGRHDEAIDVAQKGIERGESANNTSVQYVSLAFAYADRGDVEPARKAMQEALRLRPKMTVKGFLRYWHFTEPENLERFGAGLRLAGMPEERAK